MLAARWRGGAPVTYWTFIRIGLFFPWGVEDGHGKDRHGRRAWASGVGLGCARARRRGRRRASGRVAERRVAGALRPWRRRRAVAADLRAGGLDGVELARRDDHHGSARR